MRCFGLRALIPLTLCFTAACEPTNLYVAHQTVVGVNAAVNTEQTKGHLIVGYDRNFVTLVPKSVADPDNKSTNVADGGGKEAMSALSCSDLEVKGIYLTKFVEYLATGKAARTLAGEGRQSMKGTEGAMDGSNNGGSSDGLDEIFDCLK